MDARRLRVGLLALLVPLLAAAAPTTVARVFDLEHLRLGDAALLVQPLLSEEGSLTLEPRDARLTVQDRPEVVDRVARLLLALDRPPARYRVLARLYEATTDPGSGDASAADLKLGEVLRFTSFRLVGETRLEGEVGGSARADLGDGFVIRFEVEPGERRIEVTSVAAGPPVVRPPDVDPARAVDPAAARIRLEQLALLRIASARQVEVLRSSVALSTGQQVVLAASSSESARRGLVLVLRAEVPEG